MAKNQIANYKSLKVTQANLSEKKTILKNLNILCLFKSLPPSKIRSINEEFELAGVINELEMKLSCICKNEAFELSYLQVKPYYFEYFIKTKW